MAAPAASAGMRRGAERPSICPAGAVDMGGKAPMKAVITVVGRDTVGVVAKVSGVCSELNINIEDVTQSIMQEMFCMIMLVNLEKCNVSHDEMRARFAAAGEEMGMQVNITRQEVFDAMHRI